MDPSNNTPVEPNTPAPSDTPVSPAPAASTTDAAPVTSATSTTPVNADVANAALNPPVNPVVAPTAPQTNGAPAADTVAGGTMSMNQMFQAQPAAKADVFAETTAIAVPEGPKAPDPVEEELKAPLKAAGPVPGSIGSAVSMPAEGGVAPNSAPAVDLAANPMAAAPVASASPDAAAPANPANPMTANVAAPSSKKPSVFEKLSAKTKMDKKTLVVLCAVAGVVLVALIIVLIMVATGAI